MMLSILTPCQDEMMCEVLAPERAFMHGRDIEWLVEGDGESVADLRRKLLDRANGEYLLWWDADDWIRPAWVGIAVKTMEMGAPWACPPRVVRYDVHTDESEGVYLTRPLMTGGTVSADVARSVPYPEPRVPGGDADSLWWELIRRRVDGLLIETVPGAVDVVLTVHGRNLTQGPPRGVGVHEIPAEARDHIERVRHATKER